MMADRITSTVFVASSGFAQFAPRTRSRTIYFSHAPQRNIGGRHNRFDFNCACSRSEKEMKKIIMYLSEIGVYVQVGG